MRQANGRARGSGRGVCSLLAALAATGCGGRGVEGHGIDGERSGGVRADTRQPAPRALAVGASCDALLDAFQRQLLDEVSIRAERARATSLELAGLQQAQRVASPGSIAATAPASREGDLVTVEAERVYLLHANQLFVLPARPAAALEVLAAVPIEGEPRQLFVHEGQVLVLSWFSGAMPGQAHAPDPTYGPSYVKWTVIDARRAPPAIVRESYTEGLSYVPGVQHGSRVAVFLQHDVNAPLASIDASPSLPSDV